MKELFKFFVNPAPPIFITIVLVILKSVGIEIPWGAVFVPILIWNVSLLIFVALVVFGAKKILGDVVNWFKKSKKG